jgi:hypothetical protein
MPKFNFINNELCLWSIIADFYLRDFYLVTHHSEGFSGAALAVGQNTGVESLEGNIEHFDADFFKYLQANIKIAQENENVNHSSIKISYGV